ncbi:hypothetical protein ACTXT7_003141 [Hymenolepis weldensis]
MKIGQLIAGTVIFINLLEDGECEKGLEVNTYCKFTLDIELKIFKSEKLKSWGDSVYFRLSEVMESGEEEEKEVRRTQY